MEDDDDSQSVCKNEAATLLPVTVVKPTDESLEETNSYNNEENNDALNLKAAKLNNSNMPEESDGGLEKEQSDATDESLSIQKKVNGEYGKGCGSVSGESCQDLKEDSAEEDCESAQFDGGGVEIKSNENTVVESLLKSVKRKRDELQDSSSDEDSSSSSPVEFRGFKKRMIAQAEKTNEEQEHNLVKPATKEKKNEANILATSPVKSKPSGELRRSARNISSSKKKSESGDDNEESEDQLTEYAQYLGLQPTVKFKCYRCGEKNFQSMGSLNAHQKNCMKSGSYLRTLLPKPPPVTSTTSSTAHLDSNVSTNFRITRKVYLCSACGTYYENWKLFLHMRDVHKRHICLFCLGMFSVAEKLAEHLFFKHNVHDKICKSPEEFLNMFKGSCYLTCCTCEKMFTERENFFEHQCKDSPDPVPVWATDTASQKCKLCGIKCGHFQTCPNVHVNNLTASHPLTVASSPPPSTSTSTVNSSSKSSSSTLSVTKCLVSVPTNVKKEWTSRSGSKAPLAVTTPSAETPPSAAAAKTVPSSGNDDYFSDASRFCRVDLEDTHTPLSTSNSSQKRVQSPDKRTPDLSTSTKKSSSPVKNLSVSTADEKIDETSTENESSKICNRPNSNENLLDCRESDSSNVEKLVLDDSCKSSDSGKDDDDEDEEKLSSNAGSLSESDNEEELAKPLDRTIDEASDESTEQSTNEISDDGLSPAKTIDETMKIDFYNQDADFESCKSTGDKEEKCKADDAKQNVTEEVPKELEAEEEKNKKEEGEDDMEEVKEKEKIETEMDEEEASENDLKTKDDASDDEDDDDDDDDEDDDDDDEDDSDEGKDDDRNSVSSHDAEATDTKKMEQTDGIEKEHVFDTREENSWQEKSEAPQIPVEHKAESPVAFSNPPESEDKRVNNEEDIKSEMSDDSDKLSVVLSDDDSENNLDESKSGREDVSRVNDDGKINVECEDNAEIITSLKSFPSCELVQNGEDTAGTDVPADRSQKSSNSLSQNSDSNFKLVDGERVQIASEEVLAMALTLEDKVDALSSQSVVKECVRTSCTTCGYCSHAVKIGVNGKQLVLHLLAEHRYKPVKNETVDDVVERLKGSLQELQDTWFNTDSYDSSDKSCFVPYDHTYECFQCNYVTRLHKDLYLHKRKVHQKTILYCSMCKANFYSYSELLCHMCPGVYVSKDIQFRCCFCELDRIQSAFRLMVHLRKSHHTCDICLEIAGDQQKLSTHMWKHKLHHLCYRCGIAYRNKPDITKHLFWKHGTESVLCKKCLQKKWPHVYHFCIPPTVFICEECNASFSKAVALKVHKRIHAGDSPYSCTICEKKFVSKKLLQKHEKLHMDPIPAVDISKKIVVPNQMEESEKNETEGKKHTEESGETLTAVKPEPTRDGRQHGENEQNGSKQHKKKSKKDKEKKAKPVVDVYDLPPLNLSSESDDSGEESKSTQISNSETSTAKQLTSSNIDSLECNTKSDTAETQRLEDVCNEEPKLPNDIDIGEDITNEEESNQPTVVDGIWDSFHSYKAEQEKREYNLDPNSRQQSRLPYPLSAMTPASSAAIILGDHDYCAVENPSETVVDKEEGGGVEKRGVNLLQKPVPREHSSSIDHDYCTVNNIEGSSTTVTKAKEKPVVTVTPTKKKQKLPKKKTGKRNNSSSSSDSSSESNSSNCSCGTNCSCTSSSSNSSSSSSGSDSDSSSSEGRKRSTKRDKKKEKLRAKKKGEETIVKESPVPQEEPADITPVVPEELPIRESDLDTNETSTDEDFYDQYPQRHANQMLAEKRNQLMVLAAVAPVNNGTVSPPLHLPPAQIEETAVAPVANLLLPPPTPLSVQSPTVPPIPPVTPTPPNRRRIKSKKRKRSTVQQNTTTAHNSQTPYYSTQPSTSFSILGKQTAVNEQPYSTQTTTDHLSIDHQPSNVFLSNTASRPAGNKKINRNVSGTDTTKRLSKRRRVRNKFYGYSSDEEEDQQPPPPAKWKKSEPVYQQPIVQQADYRSYYQQPKAPPAVRGYDERSYNAVHPSDVVVRKSVVAPVAAPAPATSSSAGGSSSSSSADSESEPEKPEQPQQQPMVFAAGAVTEKDDKLYCYCQCPYDEVSEMIACDGDACHIEWFHFECVGIMVPPKGKWYCPDCRKKGNAHI